MTGQTGEREPMVGRDLIQFSCARTGGQTMEEVMRMSRLLTGTLLSAPWDGIAEGGATFEGCPHSNCRFTFNQSAEAVTEASALIFHSWPLFRVRGERGWCSKVILLPQKMFLPSRRSPAQRYILFSIETFSHCGYLNPWELRVLDNFFNATFTFRRDSDIFLPYGGVRRVSRGDVTAHLRSFPGPEQAAALLPLLAEKTGGLCLWRASHCWTDSRRETFVQQISRHINVTAVGKCAEQVRF